VLDPRAKRHHSHAITRIRGFNTDPDTRHGN
jgi:hypothetical protein